MSAQMNKSNDFESCKSTCCKVKVPSRHMSLDRARLHPSRADFFKDLKLAMGSLFCSKGSSISEDASSFFKLYARESSTSVSDKIELIRSTAAEALRRSPSVLTIP